MVASPVIVAPLRTQARSRRLAALLAFALLLVIPGGVAQAAAGDIGTYPLPSPSSGPTGITAGPDGGVWFTEFSSNKIGRIDPATGAIVEYALSSGSGPYGITNGPDGRVWFTEASGNRIGRIDPATGTIVEYAVPTPASGPQGVAKGSDGGVWFTENAENKIGRIDPATGAIVEYVIPTPLSEPEGITEGPDGRMWFTESSGSVNQIGRIDPTTHAIVEYPVPMVGGTTARPLGIVAGADGNLWFASGQGNRVGMVVPTSGAVSQYPMAVAASYPQGITAGPDGNLWFTQSLGNRIASIDPATAAVTSYVIPAANTHPAGIAVGPDGNLWFTEQYASAVGRFTLSYGLSAARAGTGAGTISSSPAGIDCGASCSAAFDGGTSVTLTATAADGSTFTGWTGDCAGASRTCTVAMHRARSVTATFVTRAADAVTGAPASGAAAAKPVLSATLLVPRKRLRSGAVMRIGIRVGSSGAAAGSAQACLRLPPALAVMADGGARRVGRSLCFALGRVPGGAVRTRYVSVRVVGSRPESVVVRGIARAAGATRVTTAARVVIVPRPSGSPPVTG